MRLIGKFDYLLLQYMIILQKIRKSVSKIDMFSSSEMLRYNDDAHYQTFTGGFFSLAIILTVIAGFFSMISETLNRTAISSSLNVITNSNPPLYTLTPSKESMFMFGIQIESMDETFYYDIGGPRRYFDVSVELGTLKYGVLEKLDTIPMIPCTDQHWEMFPKVVENKNLLEYNNWLCPQKNAELKLAGSYFSDIYQSVRITVSKCTNQSDISHPCYPQNEIDDLMNTYGNFYFQVNYINTVINPTEVEYRSYYIQAMEYVIFSKTSGSQIYYQFSDYQIQTDTSIWPFSSYNVDKGVLVPSKGTGVAYNVDSSEQYAFAYLTKSSQSLFYRRQVQKLSVVLSYIGGLVGAVSAALFILKLYTDTSLQVSIAKNLFKQEEEEQQSQQNIESNDAPEDTQKSKIKQSKQSKFGLISFMKIYLYQILKIFKFTENWVEARELDQLRDEIGKHLDIKNLLRRIINLQRYLTYVFDEKQLECLKHQKPMSFEQVKQLRMLFTQQIQIQNDSAKQSTGAEKELQIIDPNIGNQQIEYSINQQSGAQTSKAICKPMNLNRSRNKIVPVNGKLPHLQLKKKSILLSTLEELKVKEYFTQLRSCRQFSIINKKICQNAKNRLKCDNEQKSPRRAEQCKMKNKKRSPFLLFKSNSQSSQQ